MGMGKPKHRRSKRQLKKQKDREKRNRKNRQALSAQRERRRADKFYRKHAPLPEFKIDTTDSNLDVLALVEGGIKELDKMYTGAFDEDDIALLIDYHELGWTKMIALYQELSKREMTEEQVAGAVGHQLDTLIGAGILYNAPKNLLRRVLPTGSYTITPREHHIDVRCRSLRDIKTRHGRLYQSPYQPTVDVNDQTYKVAFTRHAVDQLADRVLPCWRQTYIGQIYVFGFLYECVFYGVVKLYSGQPAIVVYNSCLRAGRPLQDYMKELLGLKTKEELRDYYYKIGYGPLILDDGLAVVKTFLTPGYRNTPERATLSGGPRRVLRDVEMACDDGVNIISVSSCLKTRKAVEWFHHHGEPQAVKLGRKIFKNLNGPYAEIGLDSSDDLPIIATS